MLLKAFYSPVDRPIAAFWTASMLLNERGILVLVDFAEAFCICLLLLKVFDLILHLTNEADPFLFLVCPSCLVP